MNLNNCLKISSYLMITFWLIACLVILGYEFHEAINHKSDDLSPNKQNLLPNKHELLPNLHELSPHWQCAVWPKKTTENYPCLDSFWYVLELTTVIVNSVLLSLLIVGMIKRKYMLMVPWIIFKFLTMLVSSSAFHLKILWNLFIFQATL